LIGFPVLVGCIVVARPLILVLYGERWLSAVLPFQLLCAGGMLKLLNAYSSQANEASGRIWQQVRRQAFGTVLIVIGAAIGSYKGGVTGAAFGVLIAMLILSIAMQALVQRATGLTWSALSWALVPGMTAAALVVLVLLATGAGVDAMLGQRPAWQLLLIQGAVSGLSYAAFLIFSPFTAVREVVLETMNDIVPAERFQAFDWLRRRLARA
jgi:O-antigen/teichoic acid export membrane protein